jgi:hypothetical protein
MIKSVNHALSSEYVRFTGFLEAGSKHGNKAVALLFALMLSLCAPAAFAQTSFGDKAVTEIDKITPQLILVGGAILVVVGTIVAVYCVMRMMKKV